LHNIQTLGRTSSPFYELYRKVDRPTGATWISVYRSNTVRSDLNPLWTSCSLDLEATCQGDLDRALKIIVWDHRRTGKHKMMGECETTLRDLLSAAKMEESGGDPEFGFHLVKHEKEVGMIQVVDATLSGALLQHNNSSTSNINSSSSNINSSASHLNHTNSINGSGGLQSTQVSSTSLVRPSHPSPSTPAVTTNTRPSAAPVTTSSRPEFIDYLSGGCQISLAVAIDFTASNGDPRQQGTPHYFHPPESKEWNDYEKAIFAVGSILAKYDSDQQFPVWGFGAKYNNVVRHCFQCGTEIEVQGVQGIMDAYRGVFRTPLTMSYPTKFTEVIQTAAAYARHEAVRVYTLS